MRRPLPSLAPYILSIVWPLTFQLLAATTYGNTNNHCNMGKSSKLKGPLISLLRRMETVNATPMQRRRIERAGDACTDQD